MERALLDNYVYMLSPILTTVHFLEHPWPGDLVGQWTFAGIHQTVDGVLASLGDRTSAADSFGTYYAPVIDLGPVNVANYVVYLYSDFGESGVAVASGVMGLLAGWAFVRALRVKRIVEIQLAGLLMFLLIFSVRGLVTNGTMFWVSIAFIMIQHAVLSLPTRQHRRRDARIGAMSTPVA
jgi:hypothetical protein